MQTNEQRRAEYVKGLRAMADFFEAHPDLRHPKNETVNIMVDDKDELTSFARAGAWEKVYDSTWFMLRKQFGGDLILDVNIYRDQVCRKKVIGTKLLPAVEAQPAREVDDFEWVCDDVTLLSPSAPNAEEGAD